MSFACPIKSATPFSIVFLILARGELRLFAKNPAKVAGVGEAHHVCGFFRANVRIHEHVACRANTFGNEILLDGASRVFFEESAQMAVTVTEAFLEILDGDVVGQMVADVFLHAGNKLGMAGRLADFTEKLLVFLLENRSEEFGEELGEKRLQPQAEAGRLHGTARILHRRFPHGLPECQQVPRERETIPLLMDLPPDALQDFFSIRILRSHPEHEALQDKRSLMGFPCMFDAGGKENDASAAWHDGHPVAKVGGPSLVDHGDIPPWMGVLGHMTSFARAAMRVKIYLNP